MSTPRSWSGGGRRQADEGGWSRKVMEMGRGTDKDNKGKKGGRTMTPSILQMRGHCLCDPSHSGMGGTHLCHLDPLTETGRGGSSPMSPSVQKCYPRALQGLHRCLLRRGLHPPPPL